VGFSDLLERHFGAAPEVHLRPQLCEGHADSVHLLFCYFFFSIPAAKIVDWIGYQRTMVVGLLVMGAGAFLFVPAAIVPSYRFF